MALDQISLLELQLENSLAPVRPTPEFVDHLRYRLTVPADMTLERNNVDRVDFLLLFFSILSGLAMLLLVRFVIKQVRTHLII